jgi:hypothetical protein
MCKLTKHYLSSFVYKYECLPYRKTLSEIITFSKTSALSLCHITWIYLLEISTKINSKFSKLMFQMYHKTLVLKVL